MQFSSLPYKAFIKLVFKYVSVAFIITAKIFRLISIIYIFNIKRIKWLNFNYALSIFRLIVSMGNKYLYSIPMFLDIK